jgi:hypothetical protein
MAFQWGEGFSEDNDTFSLFKEILGSTEEPEKVTDDIKRIREAANRLVKEDQAERDARTREVSHILLYADPKVAGEFLAVVYFKQPKETRDSYQSQISMMMGGGQTQPNHVWIAYTSFPHALGWIEKNKYFGLKETKFHEGIMASWG